jgi:hypothetical protein
MAHSIVELEIETDRSPIGLACECEQLNPSVEPPLNPNPTSTW